MSSQRDRGGRPEEGASSNKTAVPMLSAHVVEPTLPPPSPLPTLLPPARDTLPQLLV